MSESSTRGPDECKEPSTIADTQASAGSQTSLGKIGRYLLLRPLGRGGMGEVFEAEQTEPVHRKVALKLIKGGMDTQDVLARFDSERQALALMNHLNIARMLDGGATPDGRPYFVMEYIQGVPITEYCDSKALTNPERLELFIQVCAGVQHAHQKGIIHRDIKPSNVLVTLEDEKVVPKIIDFGLAKALGPADSDMTQYTHIGQVIGTPAYMSPEQVSGADIDTRTDVYSLGVLLYQLLVGTVPFALKDTPDGGWDAFRKRICEQEPVRPSLRISSLGEDSEQNAKNRQIDPVSWTRQLHGDLDWITLKALEKDRVRRYQSPSDLAADITRHLNNEPVLASPPGRVYRLKKFVRRHRIGVAAAAIVALALIAGITGTTIGMVRATKAERAAVDEAENTRQLADFLTGLFRVSDPSEARGNTITAREILDKGAQKIEKELGNRPVLKAEMMRTIGGVYTSLGLYKQAEPLLERAVAVARMAETTKPLAKSNSMLELAGLYSTEGKYAEALSLAKEGLAIREKELGTQHVEVARALLIVGIIYRKTDKRAEAKDNLERSLSIREKVLGREHPDTLQTLFHLGWLYHMMGRNQAAAGCYERILAAREKLGPNQPEVASALGDLGSVKLDMGDHSGALKLYQRSLAIRENVLGPNHDLVAESVDNIGSALWYMGRLQEAKPYYERALQMREKALGSAHPYVIVSLKNLALLLRNIDEEEKARLLYERALAIGESADTLSDLALLLYEIGEYDKSRLLYERALKTKEKSGQPEDSRTAYILMFLGDLLRDGGQCRSAQSAYERALKIQEKEDPTNVPNTLTGLAHLHSDNGNYEKAVALYERILAIMEKAGRSRGISFTLGRLAVLHRNYGRIVKGREAYERAAAMLEQALAAAEKTSRKEDPGVVTALSNLAELHGSNGNYEKARILYERALAIHERFQSPQVLKTLCALADLHRDNREYAAAQPLYERALAIRKGRGGLQSWPVAEILVNLARIKVAQGKLSEAVPLFQRATAIGRKLRGDNPIFPYDQACYSALMKDRDEAISFLKQAIARGFDAKFRIAHNPDFAYLRGDPEFQAIVK